MRKKVLIMAGMYLPSVKGGGPIQSIKNMVDNLGDEFDFYIVTSDRDLGDKFAFKGIKTDKWVKVGKAEVMYINYKYVNWDKGTKILNTEQWDILYLNSFFSYKNSIMYILMNKIREKINAKIILSPRGQFSSGALSLGRVKKYIYITLSNIFNLYGEINWHATSLSEKKDIEKLFGNNTNIYVANNLTEDYSKFDLSNKTHKYVGELKLVHIARIHPMKNLLQSLNVLNKVKGKVEFNIFGPIEDKIYWRKCKKIIDNISDSISVNYNGVLKKQDVNNVYIDNHASLLLTFGENFGHSISEALIGGCPVIISDKTPWKKLDKVGAGYVIPLSDEEKIVETINNLIMMNNTDYKLMSNRSFKYAKENSNLEIDINAYRVMFDN